VEHPAPQCHFVWIGRVLPYHARLAIESVLVAMPEAHVFLHAVGRAPVGPHAEALAAYPRVTIQAEPLTEQFAACPGGPQPYLDLAARLSGGSPAALSNLVRLVVLRRHGGVYLDTDVLVVRGLHDPTRHGAYVGRELVWAANRERIENGLAPGLALRSIPWAAAHLARRADSRWAAGRAGLADRFPGRAARLQVNNAVIGAPAGAAFLDAALGRALTVDPSRRFALGPSLLDDVAADFPALVHLVPPSRFFAVPPGQSYRLFEDAFLELPVDAQVVHYVASNHPRLLARLEPDDRRFLTGNGPFWRIARRVQAAVASGAAATALPAAFDPSDLRRAG